MSTVVRRCLTRGLFLMCLALASCAPGTDGIVITNAATEDVDPLSLLGDTPIEISLPHIPVIALPDLSSVGHYDELLQERLGGLALRPVDGVEVITESCASGDAVLQGDESSSVFESAELRGDSFTFSIDEETGASSYYRESRRERTSVRTEADGSGEFIEESDSRHLSIVASATGAGRYYAEEDDVILAVEADANGAGVFYHQQPDDLGLTTITIGTDGSGAWFGESPGELRTVDAHADGSGDMYLKQGDRVITLRVRSDQSWELSDSSFSNELIVKVDADGTGSYRQRGDSGTISLDFDADGNSHWRETAGPLLIVPPAPSFAVADRFPALGTLATIEPPCATVLRFDSQVLFAVNEHDVLPEAAAVLAQVAPALVEAGRSLEINGHTDATGSDAYNQALSERRAQAVADVLRSLGVSVELTINGYGESQPVTENYHADGTDDEAGQRQNRRVEIVIHG